MAVFFHVRKVEKISVGHSRLGDRASGFGRTGHPQGLPEGTHSRSMVEMGATGWDASLEIALNE
jgi:hypothetical protein